jgi:hypothetical protein
MAVHVGVVVIIITANVVVVVIISMIIVVITIIRIRVVIIVVVSNIITDPVGRIFINVIIVNGNVHDALIAQSELHLAYIGNYVVLLLVDVVHLLL